MVLELLELIDGKDIDGLQQKMSAETINEHECTAKKINLFTDMNLNFGNMWAQILFKKLSLPTYTQRAEAGCYYKKKVQWKTLQIQKI